MHVNSLYEDAPAGNHGSRVHENKYPGRFPFDQKFRKFRVGERMEQTFSGISFRNFGCTPRGWPKIPENRNNRKILFHSTIPTRTSLSEPGNRTSWRELLVEPV